MSRRLNARTDHPRNGVGGRHRIPAACESGICDICKVMKRAGDADMRHDGGVSAQEIVGSYVLACCSRLLSPLEIES